MNIADDIRRDAIKLALDYGYSTGMVAPLGKFEGEPWYAVYYYDAMLNGDGEPMYAGEQCLGDLFEVTSEEREAFGLDPSIMGIALWHSDIGFETLELLTDEKYVYLLNLPEEPTCAY